MFNRLIFIAIALLLVAGALFGQSIPQAQAQTPPTECPPGFTKIGETEEGWPLCAKAEVVEAPKPEDYPALVALYNATDGANWKNKTNWLSDNSLDTWHGVSTDLNGRVTSLRLNNNGLSGTIPPELGDLSSIRTLLDLSNNQLTGSIPKELSKLTQLDNLRLTSNQLTGNIPPEFGTLTVIHYLSLNNNQLSGTLPDELTQIPSNSHLHLDVENNSGICAPADSTFQVWLRSIGEYKGETCKSPAERNPTNLSAAIVELHDDHDDHDHDGHDHDGHDEDEHEDDDHEDDDREEDEHEDDEIGVHLTWTPGSNPNYVKQVVKRREVGVRPAQWTTFDVTASASEYTDESVQLCNRYIYRVQGVKSNGKGAISNRVELSVPGECVPSGLAADLNSGAVTLSWTPSAASGVTKQIVKRREAGVRPAQWTTSDVAASASEYRDSSVQPGKQYIYRVQVVRGNNQSKLSKPVSVRVPR